MERSNCFQLNPRRYEDQLSVFGRKVLNVLVHKWNSDQNRQQKSQRNSHTSNPSSHYRRISSFRNGTQSPSASMTCQNINTESEIHTDQLFESNLNQNVHNFTDVPTACQLVLSLNTSDKTTVSISEDATTSGIPGHDLISTVIDVDSSNKIHNEIINIKGLSDERKSSNSSTTERADGVDWDKMFDSELFSAETAIGNAQVLLGQIETQASNTLNIEYFLEAKQTSETKTKLKCNDSKGKNCQKPKRKNQHIKDVTPKKVKKVNDPKNSFRKQKYTKTVNNWLHDVDPNYLAEINEQTDKNSIRAQPENTTEKAEDKSKSKVIQARLANKNGIMKYAKPNTDSTKKLGSDKTDKDPRKENNNDEIPEKTMMDKETKGKLYEVNKTDDMNKNKLSSINKSEIYMIKGVKPKSKFVAPIKSQIPVKDVEFRITTMKGNNIGNHMKTLNHIENQELVLVLIYSNGFCQLNSHHTEDLCDPEGLIIKVGDDFFYFKEDHQNYKEILQMVLENNKIICYEGKHLLIYLKSSKLDLDIYKINMIDAKIGGSLLDPDNPPENFTELQKLLSYTPQFTIATDCILQKAAWYATLLKDCASKLVYLLEEEQLWEVFTKIEMNLLPIIAEMERLGVYVDLQKLKSMEDILLTKMKAIELECYKAAGKTFQINSPVQVRALIYDELKLDAKCNMKIRETLAQGAKSTSEAMLRGLVSVHPLPRLVLEYRHLHKAHATFLTGIAQHVRDGIVRPTWVQTAAATGRIASNNPNLQAIPKAPFNLVLFPELSDSDITGCSALSFRSVYRGGAGRVLLACDFKHVECRVFAHAAGDWELQAALRAPGDLFRALAQNWLKKPGSAVTSEDRERTKRIVYASLYGAGVRKLMDILDVGYEQALAVQASFNSTFPSLRSFGECVASRCARAGGRLATLCGRRRRFQNISSPEYALRAHAQRQAVNFIVQGSAADLCKMAMVEACAQLRAHSPPLEARLLLQIHDELVWEIREDHLHRAAALIKRAMEGCGPRSGVGGALPVALSVGRSWGEMEPYCTEIEM